MSEPCPFCLIVANQAEHTLIASWPGARAIVPLNPVADGHVLVIPNRHVPDFTTDPDVSALVMLFAAVLGKDMGGDMNLITSKGEAATQSVNHLHVHLVPRHAGDLLQLPWSPKLTTDGREGVHSLANGALPDQTAAPADVPAADFPAAGPSVPQGGAAS